MSQPRIYIQNILSVVSECATRSVGISTDGLKDEIYEARRLAGLKNFNAHKQYLCQQNLLELMKMLYGEHWDPNREPAFSPDLKGESPADPNFLKLPLFGLFVKAVFTLPISSAIVEMLFSQSAHAPPRTHAWCRGHTVIERGGWGSYAYVRSKSRSAMKDGTAASILLTSELENLLADPRAGWESSFKLRNFSTGHVLGWG